MANGILDPSKFTLGTEPSMRSLGDKIAEHRQWLQQNQPALAEKLQAPQGMPQQTQQQQRQMSVADQLTNAMQQVSQSMATQAATAQPDEKGKPNRKAAEQVVADQYDLLSQVNPLVPKKSLGNAAVGEWLTGKQNLGGIYGTGIQPIDVLAFAAGIGTTWNLPQEQAQRATWAMAQLPGQLREKQAQAIKDHIQSVIGTITADTGLSNAQTAASRAQQESVQSQMQTQQFAERQRLADAFELVDPARAAALRSGATDEYLKLTGQTGTARGTGLGQRVNTILEAAREAGQPISITEAMNRAHQQEIELARARADVGRDSAFETPGAPTVDFFKLDDQTGEVQIASQRFPATASRKELAEAGFREIKDAGFRDGLTTIAPLKRSFRHLIATSMIAARDPIDAQKGITSGGRAGGEVGRAAALYNAEAKIFSQFFDKFLGGVRGAASPTLLQITQERLPKIGAISGSQLWPPQVPDSPELVASKLRGLKNVLDSMEAEYRSRMGGKADKVVSETTDRAFADFLGIPVEEYNRMLQMGEQDVGTLLAPGGTRAPASPQVQPPSSSGRIIR